MSLKMVMSHYYYKPNSLFALDLVRRDEHGNPVGYEEIKAQYGDDVIIVSFDEINEKISELAIEHPEEIDEQTFYRCYGQLPPHKSVNYGNTHSYMSSEFYVRDITRIYCKTGNRYWHMRNKETLTHDEIVGLCNSKNDYE